MPTIYACAPTFIRCRSGKPGELAKEKGKEKKERENPNRCTTRTFIQ
jgi:hypothetical protein